MNGNITFEDIDINLIYHLYCIVIGRIFEYSGKEYLSLRYSDIENNVYKVTKSIISKNSSKYRSKAHLFNYLVAQFGDNYTGVKYPVGYSLEAKKAFKMAHGVERKKHKNSIENKIKECYDKGMKQVQVVKELNVSKAVVSKWYKNFKEST